MLTGAEFKFLHNQSNNNWDFPKRKTMPLLKANMYIFFGSVQTTSFSCKATNLVKMFKKLLTFMKILKSNNY